MKLRAAVYLVLFAVTLCAAPATASTETVSLPAHYKLTVTAPAGSNGILTRLSDVPGGQSQGSDAVASGTAIAKGAYATVTRWEILSEAGQLTYTVEPTTDLPEATITTLNAASATIGVCSVTNGLTADEIATPLITRAGPIDISATGAGNGVNISGADSITLDGGATGIHFGADANGVSSYGQILPMTANSRLSIPGSNTLPATCTAKQIYVDLDAPSLCVCTATDTWSCVTLS